MKEHWNEIKKILKFGVTGVMNTAVDFVVYTVLVSVCGMGLYVSQMISYCCGMLNSYVINRKWTFDTRNGFFSLELVKFVVLNLAMMLLGMGIIYLCVEQLGLHKLLGKLISTVLVMAINFVLSNFWVFRNKGTTQGEERR
ncbi:MAG: GtrA family protein [Oscillospiraceae bacterium]|nr:GtrA family protein [Oscillospiraceae bacterium]